VIHVATRTKRETGLTLPDPATRSNSGMAIDVTTLFFAQRQPPFSRTAERVIGEELYSTQMGHHLGVSAISGNTGISMATVKRIEAGLFRLNLEEPNVRELAYALDVPFGHLRRLGTDALESRRMPSTMVIDDAPALSVVYMYLQRDRSRHPERYAVGRDMAMGLGAMMNDAGLTSKQVSSRGRVHPEYLALLLDNLVPVELLTGRAVAAIAKVLKTTQEEIEHVGRTVRASIPQLIKDSRSRAFQRGDPDRELWEA
jgi:hypothetical protein